MSEEGLAHNLTQGGRKFLAAVESKMTDLGRTAQTVELWLMIAIERYPGMVEQLVGAEQLEALRTRARDAVHDSISMSTVTGDTIVNGAVTAAKARGAADASEHDLVATVLKEAGALPGTFTLDAAVPPQATDVTGSGGDAAAKNSGTPTLAKYARDLLAEARADKLPPVVGREDEVDLVIEILCRPSKRNPALVGPPGVGKTAIAEGLALRIAADAVPDSIKGHRVYALNLASLVAGSGIVGEFEERVQKLVSEASQPDIILFLDEAHAMTGAGGRPGSGDLATLLKPSLARGEIACIAATTDDEYRQFIESDGALERRFTRVLVNEPSIDETVAILLARSERITAQKGVTVGEDVLRWLTKYADETMRNRFLPDKAIDLYEQCVGNAVSHGETAITMEVARKVAGRITGAPRTPGQALTELRSKIEGQRLLTHDTADELLHRLAVTMRRMDERSILPNAVLALPGSCASVAGTLASVTAEALYGDSGRIIEIDVTQMTENHHVSMLLGSPAGYVGHGDRLIIHELAQTPACVLLIEGADVCHPAIRSVLAEALRDGYFTDSRARRYYLSDTVIILPVPTMDPAVRKKGVIGFAPSAKSGAEADAAETYDIAGLKSAIGAALAKHIDVFVPCLPQDAGLEPGLDNVRVWQDSLTRRLNAGGVDVEWGDEVGAWLEEHAAHDNPPCSVAKYAERHITPQLMHHVDEAADKGRLRVRVSIASDGEILIDTVE